MLTESTRDYASMSSIGASIIFADAMKKLACGERYNLGLATGNTMMTEDEISVEAFARLPTRVHPLSKETIDQNTRVTAGGDESLMPRYAATMGMAPSHYHEYVNASMQGGTTTSPFAWACRMTEWGFLGNLAQLQPGKRLSCKNMK